MFQLARCVQRVDVDHHKACAQHSGYNHGVLGNVGHHDGNPVALLHTQRLKIGRKSLALVIYVAKADVLAHVRVGRAWGIGLEGLLHQCHQGVVATVVDVCRYAFRIGC